MEANGCHRVVEYCLLVNLLYICALQGTKTMKPNQASIYRDIIENGPTLENMKLLKRHVCSLNSYMGFCVHNYTFNQRRKMFSNATYFIF